MMDDSRKRNTIPKVEREASWGHEDEMIDALRPVAKCQLDALRRRVQEAEQERDAARRWAAAWKRKAKEQYEVIEYLDDVTNDLTYLYQKHYLRADAAEAQVRELREALHRVVMTAAYPDAVDAANESHDIALARLDTPPQEPQTAKPEPTYHVHQLHGIGAVFAATPWVVRMGQRDVAFCVEQADAHTIAALLNKRAQP